VGLVGGAKYRQNHVSGGHKNGILKLDSERFKLPFDWIEDYFSPLLKKANACSRPLEPGVFGRKNRCGERYKSRTPFLRDEKMNPEFDMIQSNGVASEGVEALGKQPSSV